MRLNYAPAAQSEMFDNSASQGVAIVVTDAALFVRG